MVAGKLFCKGILVLLFSIPWAGCLHSPGLTPMSRLSTPLHRRPLIWRTDCFSVAFGVGQQETGSFRFLSQTIVPFCATVKINWKPCFWSCRTEFCRKKARTSRYDLLARTFAAERRSWSLNRRPTTACIASTWSHRSGLSLSVFIGAVFNEESGMPNEQGLWKSAEGQKNF